VFSPELGVHRPRSRHNNGIFRDFERIGSWKKARDEGMLRSEGKEYVVEDADIMLFRFNV